MRTHVSGSNQDGLACFRAFHYLVSLLVNSYSIEIVSKTAKHCLRLLAHVPLGNAGPKTAFEEIGRDRWPVAPHVSRATFPGAWWSEGDFATAMLLTRRAGRCQAILRSKASTHDICVSVARCPGTASSVTPRRECNRALQANVVSVYSPPS